MDDAEAWDEERWEAFLQQNDARVERYQRVLRAFVADYPMPDPEDTDSYSKWRKARDKRLAAAGLEPDEDLIAYLLHDDPGHVDRDVALWLAQIGVSDGEPERESLHSLDHLPLYTQALACVAEAYDLGQHIPEEERDSTWVQFIFSVGQIPVNIAKGHGLGFEHDTIGGNIACVRRALDAANTALDLLNELRDEPYLSRAVYARFTEMLHELRNNLGLYVRDLREQFYLGID